MAKNLAVVAAGALLVLGLAALGGFLESPPAVERIAVVNPTEYDLVVDVTGAERDGWLALGTAAKRATTVVEDTIDQGDVWIFRFSGQGEDGGELRVTRDDLVGQEWKVEVPSRIGATLRQRGAPPSP